MGYCQGEWRGMDCESRRSILIGNKYLILVKGVDLNGEEIGRLLKICLISRWRMDIQ